MTSLRQAATDALALLKKLQSDIEPQAAGFLEGSWVRPWPELDRLEQALLVEPPTAGLIPTTEWNAMPQKARDALLAHVTYFPQNRYGIPTGYYTRDAVARYLREMALVLTSKPQMLRWIADMLE